jgi:hypothetical protein
MGSKQSTYEKLGIPSPIGETVGLLGLALTLSPYLAGVDFGILKIPDFSEPGKHAMRMYGPVVLAGSLLLFFPFWKVRSGSPRSAGTDVAATVVFRNASSRYLSLVWLTFDGTEDPEHSYSLPPGAVQEVATYVAHAWKVSDANTGEALRSVIVKREMKPVVIR